MNVDACSRNFELAPTVVREGRLGGCIGCAVGEEHAQQSNEAGAPAIETNKRADSPARYLATCVRCRRDPTDTEQYRGTRTGKVRMVKDGLHCVSCFNRGREVMLGANARGTKPRLVLREVHVTVLLDGKSSVECVSPVKDMFEAILTIAREAGGQPAFARAPQQGLKLRDAKSVAQFADVSDHERRGGLWVDVDHACGYCTGRIMRSSGGSNAVYQCSSCRATSEDTVDSLCCCGLPGYECIRNPAARVDGDGSPEIVVLDHNLPSG